MKIKNLRIKQLIKVANLMNRYPALSEAQQEVYQYATNIVYLIFKADGGPVGGRKAARQKVRSPSQQPKGE